MCEAEAELREVMVADVAEHPQLLVDRRARTNLFAMATVYADTGSMPVKVRNLSSTGARIEGVVLPAAGVQIRMRRGSLEVTGEIVWCGEGAAGVRFDSSIAVANWLPRGRSISAQQRIDDAVHQARLSSGVTAATHAHVPDSEPIALDLMRLARSVEALSEDLADDSDVIKRYGDKLQFLEMAAVALRKLAADS